MISKAFSALVARTAVGEYAISPQSGLLEPSFSLNQAAIDSLVQAAMTAYGYVSRRAAMDDIYQLSATSSLQYGEGVAALNMLRCASGDILRLTGSAGSVLTLLCMAPARLLVLHDASGALIYGDILRPLIPNITAGGQAIFAVERDGYPYPSDTRYYRIGYLGKIESAPNDGADIFAGVTSEGRMVPHMDVSTVYCTHGNHGARGFDAEDFSTDAQAALFRIDFNTDGRITYCLNRDFKLNYDGMTPDERRAVHDRYVAEAIRMCSLAGDEAPLHRLDTIAPGVLTLEQRNDGFASLIIKHRAEIGIKKL